MYEYVINARQGGQANDTAHMFQFIVHASLDVIDETLWTSSNMYLKVIDKFNETSISAYCTAGNCKFLLLHDGKSDDSVKSFFVDVHEVYVKLLLNPFYEPNTPITTPSFDARIKALVKKHL